MDPFFFGYGSLVNRQTHDYPDAMPATIRGWRREWRRSLAFGRTFLSVVPDPDATIDGMLARVPRADWAALDAREAGYARHPLLSEHLTSARPVAAQLYAIAPEASQPAGPDHPIRLSYLDVVVAGFMAEFGASGVTRFFQSTSGWTAALDDRAAPLYARARPVSAEVQALVDDWLTRFAVARCTG